MASDAEIRGSTVDRLQMTDNEFQGGGGFVFNPQTMQGTSSCSPTAFPVNVSGEQCDGLTAVSAGDPSAEACRNVCCNNAKCNIWQWCEPGTGLGCGCWVDADGSSDPCGPTHSGGPWTGQSKYPATINMVDSRIEDNQFTGAGTATRVTRTFTLAPGTVNATFDFCQLLITPNITRVEHSTTALGGFAPDVRVSLPSPGCQLLASLPAPAAVPVMATVTVDCVSYTDTCSLC